MSHIHLTFRGFNGSRRVFEEERRIMEQDFDAAISELTKRHCDAIDAESVDMIEIEFMGEPDINQRFFRIGTSPAGMVAPKKLLRMWTVYRNPSDYPGKFVVRESVTIPIPPYLMFDPEPLVVCDSLEEARAALPQGAFNLGRNPGDEPQIAEVWL